MFDNKVDFSNLWNNNEIDQSNNKIVRFINSAIYVEGPPLMPPYRKSAHTPKNYTDQIEYHQRFQKSIRCSCCSNPSNCPNHIQANSDESEPQQNRASSTVSISDSESQRTITRKPQQSSLRLSLTSLIRADDPQEKTEIIQDWLTKKQQLRKQKIQEEQKLRQTKEQERQQIIEKERESFKKWLAEKKRQEEIRRRQQEIEEQRRKILEAEKERREFKNELSYNMWLKKKKQEELEKKIREKMEFLRVCEERERRLEENQLAFKEWLKNSKNKPRPIPLNQGLQSLCSSLSVTYINPVPWNSNIQVEEKQK